MSRKLLYIFGGTILVLVIVVLVIIFLQRRVTPPATNTNSKVSVPNVNTVVLNTNQTKSNTNAAVSSNEVDERKAVERIASDFASIYGSFSNQNNFQNITDLYFYMTPALKTEQQQFVAAEKAKNADTSIYNGTTSVAQIVNVEQFDLSAGTAQVKVTLQRVDTTSSTTAKPPYFQSLTMNFERPQGAWKVAHIAWGPKQ